MTDIEIVNAAIANLGGTKIAILDDSTPEGQVAGPIYPVTRDALLQARQWTFNKDRAALTLDAAVPAFKYAYKYQLPPKTLSIIRLWESDGRTPVCDWVRERSFVLTNTAAPVMAELKVQVSEAEFPPLFTKALIAQLSADLAIPLTENRTAADSWETKAAARLLEATVEDGKQGTSEAVTLPNMPGRRGRWGGSGRFF